MGLVIIMAKKAAAKKEKTVSLTYIGRRFNGEKVVKAFTHNDGSLVLFGNIKAVIIGNRYLATVEKSGLKMPVFPEHDDKEYSNGPTDDQINEWQIADAVVVDTQKRKALAKRMQTSPQLQKAADSILPLLNGLNFSQQRQLVEIIMSIAITKKGSR